MQEIKIGQNDANQRLDKFLQKHYISLSRSMMYKGIRTKKIKVNRKRCTPDQILKVEDSVLLFLPDEFLQKRKKTVPVYTGDIDIVYEDQDLLIVNKPLNLLSQSDEAGLQDCLLMRIQYYLYQKKEYDPLKENSFSPSLCHRLDKNTRGLVIAAKNAETLRNINEAIADRKLHKYYCAHIMGHFHKDAFTVRTYIKKQETKALVSDEPKDGYKEAIMDVRVIKETKEGSILDIELHTGRFHQIRASLSHLGHPLIGDFKYGYTGPKKHYDLCAYRLESNLLKMNPVTIDIPF